MDNIFYALFARFDTVIHAQGNNTKQGASIQWRENTHKMAEANKLFAHFAW